MKMAKQSTTTTVDSKVVEAHAPLAPPANSFQSIPLDAWLRHKTGAKFDECAGFRHWAKKQNHTRHSSAEWDALFTAFNNRPIGL